MSNLDFVVYLVDLTRSRIVCLNSLLTIYTRIKLLDIIYIVRRINNLILMI